MDGFLASLGCIMIGGGRVYGDEEERVTSVILKSGKFRPDPSISFWSLGTLYCSHGASFGVLACHQGGFSCLGE